MGSRHDFLGRGHVLPVFLFGLFLALVTTQAFARFELINEWVIPDPPEGMFYAVAYPDWPLKDGSMFMWDPSGLSDYPLWRVEGNVITPLAGFAPGPGRFQFQVAFNVGDMVVVSGLLDDVRRHWKVEGDGLVSLEPLFGPIPFTGEWLWTPIASGVVFSARTEAHGRELWRMDEQGYHLVFDLNPGPGDSHPGDAGWDAVPIYDWYETFVRSGQPEARLMYSLDDGETGTEPWVFDAETLTLTKVAELAEGADGSHPWWLGSMGGNEYFGTIEKHIFRSDKTSAMRIDDGSGHFSYGYRHLQHVFGLEGAIYPWWEPHGFDASGYFLRITSDDDFRRFTVRTFPFLNDEVLVSVFPFDGAVQVVSETKRLKLEDDQFVASDLFSGAAKNPGVIAWSESEVMFEETGFGLFKNDVYCLVNGEAVPMWRKPTDLPFERMTWTRRGEWVYLRVEDALARENQAGGRIQLWGMQFPGGCSGPWQENFQITSQLNDAWYNPLTPGQGFFITVYESLGTVFLAWFTFDTERPAGGTPSVLGEAGHRWMTAYGPFQGDLADLELENSLGGVFNSATPAVEQRVYGSIDIRFIDCNNAVIEYRTGEHPVPSTGTIAIQRISDSNIAACQQAAAQ